MRQRERLVRRDWFQQVVALPLNALRKKAQIQSRRAFCLDHYAHGYSYWFFHGLNYLCSLDGTLLFPEVYDEAAPPLYKTQGFVRVVKIHLDGEILSAAGRRGMLWMALKPVEMFEIAAQIEDFAREQKGSHLIANDSVTAEAFQLAGALLEHFCPEWNSLTDLQQRGTNPYNPLGTALCRHNLRDYFQSRGARTPQLDRRNRWRSK